MTSDSNPEPSGEDQSRPPSAAPDEVATWVASAVDGDREAMQRLLLLYHEQFRQFVARSMEPRIKARLEP